MEELWRENNIFYNVLCFVITENEKLFDRNDANLYWRTVFHAFGMAHHAYVGIFAMGLDIMSHSDLRIRSLYTFRAAYLTGWNFIFQTVFLGLSLSHDILEWIDKHDTHLGTKINYWKNVIFNGMVVPYTLFVTAMFWCIYAIDRELVFPKIYDEVVPWWFNQCVHTNITVMIVIETLLQARRYPTDVKMETILHLIVAVAYTVVYYSIYYFTRRWLYQVFGIMTWWQVCLFQILIWTSCYVFYRIHFPINRLIHGSEDSKGVIKEKEGNGIVANNDTNDNKATNGINGINNGTNGIHNGTNGISNGTNGIHNGTNGNSNDHNIKFPIPTNSLSVKYRSTKNQFQKSQT